MSQKEDQKLGSVVLARYHYRYEAEFAAGFLDDAGIPYRLQIDDGGMGITISEPATIWVRGLDLRDAREVLDIREQRHPEPEEITAHAVEHGPPIEDEPASRSGSNGAATRGAPVPLDRAVVGRPRSVTHRSDAHVPRSGAERAPALTEFERLLAFLLLVGDLGAVGFVQSGGYGAVWIGVLAVVAATLAGAALTGRTVAPVRRVLRAISGSAP